MLDDDPKAAAGRAIAAARATHAALIQTIEEVGELLPELEPADADRLVDDLRLMIEVADYEFRRGVFAIRK
jgi:hypothetical protein